MNKMQIFRYEDNQIRIILKDGEPWWVLADVCQALKLEREDRTTRGLDRDERNTYWVRLSGKAQCLFIINESGLYKMIRWSDKPEVKKFTRWITHEVLPAIRRTGQYKKRSGCVFRQRHSQKKKLF